MALGGGFQADAFQNDAFQTAAPSIQFDAIGEPFYPVGLGGHLQIGGRDIASAARITSLYRASAWDGANLGYVWTRTNGFLWSEDITQAPWSVTGSVKTAPDKLTEVDTTASHYVSQAGQTGGYKWISGEFMQAERTWVYLFLQAGAIHAWFDLVNGVVGTVAGTDAVATITPVGDGYYKCTLRAINTANTSPGFGPAPSDAVSSYTGVLGSGIMARKLMWDHGDTVRDYLFSGATNGTATDTTTSLPTALLKLSARTQLLTNSTFSGYGSIPNIWTRTWSYPGYTEVVPSNYSGDGAQAILCSRSTTASTNPYFSSVASLEANKTYCYSILIEDVSITTGSLYARSLISVAMPSGGTIFYPPCPANPYGGPTSNKTLQPGILKMILVNGITAGNATIRAGFGISDAWIGYVKMSRPQVELGTERTAFIPTVSSTATVTDYSYTDAGDVTLSDFANGIVGQTLVAGDGVTTDFIVTAPDGYTASNISIYKTDWQGKVKQFATARTNILSQSGDLSKWAPGFGGTGSTPTTSYNSQDGPDGTPNTASRFTFNSGAGTTSADYSWTGISCGQSVTAGSIVTSDIWVRGTAGDKLWWRHAAAGTGALITIAQTGVWQKVSLTEVALSTAIPTFTIGIRQGMQGTINSTVTVDIAYGMVVVGSPYCGSYIPNNQLGVTTYTDYSLTGTTASFTTAPASGSLITSDYTYTGKAAIGDYIWNGRGAFAEEALPIGGTGWRKPRKDKTFLDYLNEQRGKTESVQIPGMDLFIEYGMLTAYASEPSKSYLDGRVEPVPEYKPTPIKTEPMELPPLQTKRVKAIRLDPSLIRPMEFPPERAAISGVSLVFEYGALTAYSESRMSGAEAMAIMLAIQMLNE